MNVGSDTRKVRIPVAGDPLAAVTSEDFSAARRTFRAEMNTGPDPYADPARWIGTTDVDQDERRSE
jgi:hypothetical protein